LPRKRIGMKQSREIIRLKHVCDLSERAISNATKLSRPTVGKICRAFKESGLSYEKIQDLSDTELSLIFSDKKVVSEKAEILIAKFPEFAIELKKKGVTLQLLWEEYIAENPDGLRSSQFGRLYNRWRDDKKISMHMNHKAGDKMYIDYAGHNMKYTNRETGEIISTEIYVAILPASQLTFVEASTSQNQEEFMRSTERALRYFGGVPSAIVPDNLKSGVITANIFEPEINRLFGDFADHYRTAVVPTRARKPKDKAHVENAVKICYRRIMAPLRNDKFYSLDELNKAIKVKLEVHNNKKLSNMKVSRRELFEKVEKGELKSLPIERYPLKHIQDSRVAFNYHVQLKVDKHYYSVPYLLKGKEVRLIYDDRNVAIYNDNIRIVQHKRNRLPHKYTTRKDHMPLNHRFADNWDPQKIKGWAESIGRDTLWVVTSILDSKKYPEQAYKSCMGILGQAKKYGGDFLELACRKASNLERVNYKFISEEVIRIKEQYDIDQVDKQPSLLPEIHENIRGQEYYK